MIASEQNYFITVSVERAERAIAALLDRGIAIQSVEIGRYTAPVIRVHYSEECQTLKGHGFRQSPNSARGVMLTNAALEECLVVWEEPLPRTLSRQHLRSVRIH